MSTASVRPGNPAPSDAERLDRQPARPSDQHPTGDNGSTERDKGDRLIGEHLEAVRAALWRSVFLKNVLLLCAGLFTACLTFIIIDQWIYSFSTPVRLVWLLALVGLSCWWTVSRLIPLIRMRVSPEYAAFSIEHDEPELQHSLTSYVTLRDDRDAPGLRGIVVRSIGARAAKHLTTSGMSMPTEALGNFRTGLFTAGAFAALVLYAVFSPKNTVQTISRLAAPLASITPPSRVSILEVTPGDTESLYGRPLDVAARITGLNQSEVPTIVVSGATGLSGDSNRTIELAPSNQSERFTASLPASIVQDDFQYQIRAGDAKSDWFNVVVRDEPTVTIAEVQYAPHPYTGLPPRTSSIGAIDGLEGTRVTVVAKANRKIVRGRIEFNPRQVGEQTNATGGFAALDISEDGQTVSATWNLRTGNRSGGQVEIDSYRLRVWDETDTQNPDPIEFPIRVSADLAPEVRITVPSTWPKDVPLGTEQLVEVRAADPDFGLTKVEVRVRRGTRLLATTPILQPKVAQQANAQEPTSLRGPQILEYRFLPDKLGLMSGDLVTIEAVAYDNRTNIEGTKPDPNITVSDPIELNIVDRPAPNEVVEDGDGLQQPTPKNEQQQDKQDQAGDDSQQSEDGQGDDSQSGDQQQSGENSGDQSDEKQEQSGEGDQPQDQQDSQQHEQQQGGGGASEEQDAQKGEGQGSGQSGGSGDQNKQKQNEQQGNQSKSGGSNSSPDNSSNQDSPASQSGQSSDESSESNANNDPASENSDPNSPAKQGQGAGQGSPSNDSSSQPPAENTANQPQKSPRSPASNDGEAMERIRDYLNQKQSTENNKERTQDDSLEGGAESPNQDGPQPNPEEQTKQDKGDRPQNASGQGTGKKDPNQDPNNQKSNNQSTGNPESKDQNKNQNQPKDNQQNQSGAGDDSQQPPQTQTDTDNKPQDGKPSTTSTPNDKTNSKPSDAKPTDKPAGNPDGGQSDNAPSTDKTGNPSSENSTAQQQPQDQTSNNSASDASSNASPSKNQTPSDSQQPSNNQQSSDAQNGSQNQSSNTDPSDANSSSNPASNNQENPNQNNSESNDPNNPQSGSQQPGTQSTAKPPQDPSQMEQGDPARGNAIGNNTSGEAMPDGFRGDAASSPQAPDPVDVEAAKKATDLVLDSLKNQRENPDQELLDRLGWTDDQLRRFVDRWEKTRKLGEQNDPAAQKQFEEAMKSLGIRPPGATTPRRSTSRDDQLQQLQDTGSRMAAPPQFREAIEAYRRSLKNND